MDERMDKGGHAGHFYMPTQNMGSYCRLPRVRQSVGSSVRTYGSPFLCPAICWSVHNCPYCLQFLVDLLYFWGVGQYHRYDNLY